MKRLKHPTNPSWIVIAGTLTALVGLSACVKRQGSGMKDAPARAAAESKADPKKTQSPQVAQKSETECKKILEGLNSQIDAKRKAAEDFGAKEEATVKAIADHLKQKGGETAGVKDDIELLAKAVSDGQPELSKEELEKRSRLSAALADLFKAEIPTAEGEEIQCQEKDGSKRNTPISEKIWISCQIQAAKKDNGGASSNAVDLASVSEEQGVTLDEEKSGNRYDLFYSIKEAALTVKKVGVEKGIILNQKEFAAGMTRASTRSYGYGTGKGSDANDDLTYLAVHLQSKDGKIQKPWKLATTHDVEHDQTNLVLLVAAPECSKSIDTKTQVPASRVETKTNPPKTASTQPIEAAPSAAATTPAAPAENAPAAAPAPAANAPAATAPAPAAATAPASPAATAPSPSATTPDVSAYQLIRRLPPQQQPATPSAPQPAQPAAQPSSAQPSAPQPSSGGATNESVNWKPIN